MNMFEQMFLLTRPDSGIPPVPNFHPEFDNKLDSLISDLDDHELDGISLELQSLEREPCC